MPKRRGCPGYGRGRGRWRVSWRPAAWPPRSGSCSAPAPPLWLGLVVLLAVGGWGAPACAGPPSLMAFLKRSAPLVVVALGQLFVIVGGEFDLSVGALMTACVVIAARLGAGEPGRTWWVIVLLLLLGVLVGLVNGLVTTVLRVPSFITTLGSMLVLNGAVFLWTGGSPNGAPGGNPRHLR